MWPNLQEIQFGALEQTLGIIFPINTKFVQVHFFANMICPGAVPENLSVDTERFK